MHLSEFESIEVLWLPYGGARAGSGASVPGGWSPRRSFPNTGKDLARSGDPLVQAGSRTDTPPFQKGAGSPLWQQARF